MKRVIGIITALLLALSFTLVGTAAQARPNYEVTDQGVQLPEGYTFSGLTVYSPKFWERRGE